MFHPHCNCVAEIKEKVVCLHLGQSSPTQETCMVVTVTIRMGSPKGEIRLKGQRRALRFPNYFLIANLGFKFDILRNNKKVYLSFSGVHFKLFVLLCCISHLA